METIDVAALMGQVSKGDDDAFSALYYAYYPILVRYGKSISSDQELITDTIQDLFTWLWQNQDQAAKIDQPDKYFFKSFRNNLISVLQKQQRQKEILDTAIQPHTIQSSAIEPEILQDSSDHNFKALHRLIEELPQKQREVIFLRFFQEKSYAEIAEILSVTTQVAQNYASRALIKLRQHSDLLEKLFYPIMAIIMLI